MNKNDGVGKFGSMGIGPGPDAIEDPNTSSITPKNGFISSSSSSSSSGKGKDKASKHNAHANVKFPLRPLLSADQLVLQAMQYFSRALSFIFCALPRLGMIYIYLYST